MWHCLEESATFQFADNKRTTPSASARYFSSPETNSPYFPRPVIQLPVLICTLGKIRLPLSSHADATEIQRMEGVVRTVNCTSFVEYNFCICATVNCCFFVTYKTFLDLFSNHLYSIFISCRKCSWSFI